MMKNKIESISKVACCLVLSVALCLPTSAMAATNKKTIDAQIQPSTAKADTEKPNFPNSARLEFPKDYIPGTTGVESGSYSLLSTTSKSKSVTLSKKTQTSKTKKTSSKTAKSKSGKKTVSKVKKATQTKTSNKANKAKKTKKIISLEYSKVMKFALRYKGWRYQWGGRFPRTSFDCAGLVIHVYNTLFELDIDRAMTNASRLYNNHCKPILKSEAKPGDLVFWRGTYGNMQHISHVGIYCGNDIAYAAGDPIGYYEIYSLKNIKGKPVQVHFARLKNIKITNVDEFGEVSQNPTPTTFYGKRDYELVYDYDYYVNKYPEVEKLYKGNDKKVLWHFIKYGMPEGQQAKKSFDVKAYRSKNKDLRKLFKNNLKKYYYHYLNRGFKQHRKTT